MVQFNITSENMRGGFRLIKVSSVPSNEIILFGTYRGGYEGRLLVPPQSTLTTQLISEIHSQLVEMYPKSIWTVNYDKDSKNYADLKEMFESAGIKED